MYAVDYSVVAPTTVRNEQYTGEILSGTNTLYSGISVVGNSKTLKVSDLAYLQQGQVIRSRLRSETAGALNNIKTTGGLSVYFLIPPKDVTSKSSLFSGKAVFMNKSFRQ